MKGWKSHSPHPKTTPTTRERVVGAKKVTVAAHAGRPGRRGISAGLAAGSGAGSAGDPGRAAPLGSRDCFLLPSSLPLPAGMQRGGPGGSRVCSARASPSSEAAPAAPCRPGPAPPGPPSAGAHSASRRRGGRTPSPGTASPAPSPPTPAAAAPDSGARDFLPRARAARREMKAEGEPGLRRRRRDSAGAAPPPLPASLPPPAAHRALREGAGEAPQGEGRCPGSELFAPASLLRPPAA